MTSRYPIYMLYGHDEGCLAIAISISLISEIIRSGEVSTWEFSIKEYDPTTEEPEKDVEEGDTWYWKWKRKKKRDGRIIYYVFSIYEEMVFDSFDPQVKE